MSLTIHESFEVRFMVAFGRVFYFIRIYFMFLSVLPQDRRKSDGRSSPNGSKAVSARRGSRPGDDGVSARRDSRPGGETVINGAGCGSVFGDDHDDAYSVVSLAEEVAKADKEKRRKSSATTAFHKATFSTLEKRSKTSSVSVFCDIFIFVLFNVLIYNFLTIQFIQF